MDRIGGSMTPIAIVAVLGATAIFIYSIRKTMKMDQKTIERGLKMTPLLIHLPPTTDDIEGGGRDSRSLAEEEISRAESMYEIIASTYTKMTKYRAVGQRHLSFEIVATPVGIKYYALVPMSMKDLVKQAVQASYPTARLEEVQDPNFFNDESGRAGTVGGEMSLKKSYIYPVATYKDTQKDAALAMLNALSEVKVGDGVAIQILLRPAHDNWTSKAVEATGRIRDGKKVKAGGGTELFGYLPQMLEALWKPPGAKEREKEGADKPLSNLQQAEIEALEEKIRHPGFEVMIRLIASSSNKARAEALARGVSAVFSQFNSVQFNGFNYNTTKDIDSLVRNYLLRVFPGGAKNDILNSVELASIFHLPSQSSIPTSKVQKQSFRQVDGPSVLPREGLLLGVNEFRGERKEIRLTVPDRRRHLYMIGGTGVGKTGFLHNLAYQDMMDGRGFAFIDPHGDAVEELMSMVPEERIDDVIYFNPGDMTSAIGLNMFEFNDPDEKDFIIQEGINMLYSLYDPGHTGIFGPRGETIFRNAALLLMSDPAGATFIDIPRVVTDPEFCKSKLQYVTDKTVFDFWTKEWPASQKSNDSGEVVSWFVSKWGPFLSNTMLRNIMGQVKSGFDIREVMDSGKILLVNLSKGKMGELNSRLIGMIFVMKFQTAAMNRADTPEDQRKDFCLFVDEFQNFSTDSFESILSEARKFRLSLVVANQFMTQLTDRIREAIIGNIGTIVAGRVGVTDAELLQKAFTPTFTAEDLHKLPNYQAVATVMVEGVPSAPFSMSLLPPMGEANLELLESLRAYSAVTYGKTRSAIDAEIKERIMDEIRPEAEAVQTDKAVEQETPAQEKQEVEQGRDFLKAWYQKRDDVKNTTGEPVADRGGIEPVVNNNEQVKSARSPVVENTSAKITPQEGVVNKTENNLANPDGKYSIRRDDGGGETKIKLR